VADTGSEGAPRCGNDLSGGRETWSRARFRAGEQGPEHRPEMAFHRRRHRLDPARATSKALPPSPSRFAVANLLVATGKPTG